MSTMNIFKPTSKDLSDHYMAAAKWARAIEGTKKVKDIGVDDSFTAIHIDGDRILRSTELESLSKLCKASGLEWVITHGTTDLIILIKKA